MKSIKDIAWNVSEETYRADSALSYSTLARFAREGFEHLDTLFDKVESPSLTFGSMVDTLITEGESAFNEKFFVGNVPMLTASLEPIIKKVYELYHNSYTNINDIHNNYILPIVNEFAYQPRWKDDTRCDDIKKKGFDYYQTMFRAEDKTIVSQELYNKAFSCVSILRNSPQTKFAFDVPDPFSNVEVLHQLKFKTMLNGISYRCMFDALVVDHDKKTICPVDLKTSSNKEYNFPKSFIKWRYDIQGKLYTRILKSIIEKDEYFKNFTIEHFRFIVVSSTGIPLPLVWLYESSFSTVDMHIGNTTLEDPENIGMRLHHYLNEKPAVPNGVVIDGINSIEKWLESNNESR